MKPTRARVLLAAGLMALAGTATATVLAAGPASAASSPVVLVSCAGHGQVRPATYDIGCMPSQELAARPGRDELALGRLRRRRAESQRLHTDLRLRQLRQLPDPDGSVAGRAVAEARGPGVLQPAHVDFHGQAARARASRPDLHAPRRAAVTGRRRGVTYDPRTGSPDSGS